MQEIAKERGISIIEVMYAEEEVLKCVKWTMKDHALLNSHDSGYIDEVFEQFCSEDERDSLSHLINLVEEAYRDIEARKAQSTDFGRLYKTARCLFSGEPIERHRTIVAFFITLQVCICT